MPRVGTLEHGGAVDHAANMCRLRRALPWYVPWPNDSYPVLEGNPPGRPVTLDSRKPQTGQGISHGGGGGGGRVLFRAQLEKSPPDAVAMVTVSLFHRRRMDL
jgi:hypothetical protein